jgi:hypothetical protein
LTAYFDEKARAAREASDRFKLDEPAFLAALAEIERPMIHEVSLLTGDREFPEDLRERIQTAIAVYKIEQTPSLPENRGPEWAHTMRESGLVERLHSLFHEVGGRRLKTRYGLIFDSPIGFLRERGDLP